MVADAFPGFHPGLFSIPPSGSMGRGGSRYRRREVLEEVGPRFLVLYWQGAFTMHHLYTPFVVVPLIVVVFFSCILWATSTKEDGHSSH
jgi:hypothetical protein